MTAGRNSIEHRELVEEMARNVRISDWFWLLLRGGLPWRKRLSLAWGLARMCWLELYIRVVGCWWKGLDRDEIRLLAESKEETR